MGFSEIKEDVVELFPKDSHSGDEYGYGYYFGELPASGTAGKFGSGQGYGLSPGTGCGDGTCIIEYDENNN